LREILLEGLGGEAALASKQIELVAGEADACTVVMNGVT